MEANIHILVVDDNNDNLKVESNYLTVKGYKIALAQNGKDALKILENNNMDLVLLDIMMPGMDGFEVCRHLKINSATKSIPVIFLSAKTDSETIAKSYNIGGVDYLTKPFIKEELYTKIHNHIRIKQLKDRFKKQMGEMLNKGMLMRSSADELIEVFNEIV